MAKKQAKLPDGTILEFPPETADAVIDKAVRTHMGVPEQKPLGVGGAIRGAADVALSAARGLVNKPAATVVGIGTGIGEKLAGGSYTEGHMRGVEDANRRIAAGEGIVGDARLRTPEGPRVAEALGKVPIGYGATVGDVSRGLENVGAGIERMAGPAARDIAGSAAELATLRGPASVRPVTAAAKAVDKARRWGFMPSPTTPTGLSAAGKPTVAGTPAERLAAGIGGAGKVDDTIAVRNQAKTDTYAAKAGELGDTPSPASLTRAKSQADQAYANLKAFNVNVPLNSQAYQTAVMKLGDGVAGFPDKASATVRRLQRQLLSATPTVPNIVDKVRELRASSYKNKASADVAAQELGVAQRAAADLLDDQLDQFMKQAVSTTNNANLKSVLGRLHGEYTKARTKLSTLHDIEDAMNPATGTVDAAKIAGLRRPGMNPELLKIADAYDALGANAMKNVSKASRGASIDITSADLAFIPMSAYAGAQIGGGTGAAIATLAPAATRLLAREYATRGYRARAIGGSIGAAARGGARAAAGGTLIEDEQP
jgi:hypothetical protein